MNDTINDKQVMNTKIQTDLTDIPETLLWTLHNRASESLRADGIIKDPKCEAIYQAIDYDYVKSFGQPDGSHATRSLLFDNKIREFLANYPDGVIVNLGEGLETQRFRIPTKDTLWLTIDLPETIAFRERFISPDEYHRHIAISALDTAWFDEVPENRPVFISAQGLLMYFTESQVQALMTAIGERFATVWLMFDFLPVMMSKKTTSKKGWMKTRHYRAPAMPWGMHRKDVEPTFRQWLGKPIQVEHVRFVFPRGFYYWLSLSASLPIINKFSGGIVLIRYG